MRLKSTMSLMDGDDTTSDEEKVRDNNNDG